MKWLIGLLALLVAGATALATCPAPVVVRPAVTYTPVVSQYVAPVVVRKVVYEAPVATVVAIPVPIYVGSYAPPVVAAPVPPGLPGSPVAPGASAPSADTRAILDALRGLDDRLRALEGRPAGAPSVPTTPGTPPTPRPADPFNPTPKAPTPGEVRAATEKAPPVFANKCAGCHQRGKESEGGGFVLMESDGSLARLDAKSTLKATRRIYNGSMPPRGNKLGITPLTDEDVGVALSYLETLK